MALVDERWQDLTGDEELMEMLRNGEVEAGIAGLQARYERRIFHFVYGMLGDLHLAQDVTQEVFERVFLKHCLYRPGSNFRAWLFEVARNQALSALRARKRTPRPITALSDQNDHAECLHGLSQVFLASPRLLKERVTQKGVSRRLVAYIPRHLQYPASRCLRVRESCQREVGRRKL